MQATCPLVRQAERGVCAYVCRRKSCTFPGTQVGRVQLLLQLPIVRGRFCSLFFSIVINSNYSLSWWENRLFHMWTQWRYLMQSLGSDDKVIHALLNQGVSNPWLVVLSGLTIPALLEWRFQFEAHLHSLDCSFIPNNNPGIGSVLCSPLAS